MARAFASREDTGTKKVTFTKLSANAYAYAAEGDPTSGVVIGDDGVMVIDTRATPHAAQDLIGRIRRVTKKPIRYVVLTHYHAVRVLGAAAYDAEQIICSEATADLIAERGAQDFASEVERFPRLFDRVETVPGLTRPTITFTDRMTLAMGRVKVEIMHLGRGHTKGDTIVWLPAARVLFSGDLVENGATPYTGDAYIAEWPKTLRKLKALKPRALVPGRGPALTTPAAALRAIDRTAEFLTALRRNVKTGVARGETLKEVYDRTTRRLEKKFGHWAIFDHCMPFDIARCYDEVSGVADPKIWTARRDLAMWKALEGGPAGAGRAK